MPAYIDAAALRQRFGQEIDQLIDAEPDADPAVPGNVEKLARACEDAQSLIDGYLGGRYTLPLVNVPSLVASWAADIARFKLWDDRAPEEVRKRYEDALAQMKLLANGAITLPPGSDGAAPVAVGFAYGAFSDRRIFTANGLRGY